MCIFSIKKVFSLITLIVTVIFFCVILNGCDYYGAGNEKSRACYTLCSYAIPGGYADDVGEISNFYIEKDNHGRVLFTTTGYKGASAIAIIQYYDDENVYYYDNVCYLSTEMYDKYSQEQVDYLKKINDWNEDLDYDKMVQRKLHSEGYDQALKHDNYKSCRSLIMDDDLIAIPEGYKYDFFFCDKSQSAQELYFIRVFAVDENGNSDKTKHVYYYLVIIEADGSYDSENSIIEIPDILESNAPLAKIKELNGWVG